MIPMTDVEEMDEVGEKSGKPNDGKNPLQYNDKENKISETDDEESDVGDDAMNDGDIPDGTETRDVHQTP